MEPTTFERPGDFRAWLEQHHDSEPELWVGYFKKGTGKASMTWPESVDEALCFGWIDGIRKSIMPNSYRQAAIRWVMTAKKEETRERRLATLVEDSAAGRAVPPLTRRPPSK